MEGGEATENAKLVTELNQRQNVYSTREMRRNFIQKHSDCFFKTVLLLYHVVHEIRTYM